MFSQFEMRELSKNQRQDYVVGLCLRPVIDKTLPVKHVYNLTMSRLVQKFRSKRDLLYLDVRKNGENSRFISQNLQKTGITKLAQ